MRGATNSINQVSTKYSTTEHLTGRKWIDGKPIYEKTVDCGALPDSGEKTVAHNIANIDYVINYYGVACNPISGGYFKIPFAYPYIGALVGVTISKTVVALQTGSDRTSYTISYVTIEYTKTTD